MYHHVGIHTESLGHQRLWISPERFAEQMSYLSQSGYHCLTLRDVAVRLRESRRVPRTVVLTFDDAYKTFYEIALPILRQYGFSATVFAVTGEVGGVSRWDSGPQAALMSWSELRELHQIGIEVGSHTVSHPRLTDLSLAAIRHEVKESRATLEDQLGVAANSFAYPFGMYNRLIERTIQDAGYETACSIVRGNLHSSGERYRLKRVPVDDFSHPSRFQRRLSPVYDLTCRFHRWSTRLREQVKCSKR
jgi:peptidoglycan/xylan/chitin deacetylase (PgdA/CDA1 family)